jgi:hypothetical protein
METRMKKYYLFLVRFKKRKLKEKNPAKSVITKDAALHHMRTIRKIYSKILNHKVFESMCNIYDAF